MTRDEQAAIVVGLACLTEDRTDAEQRAMLAFTRQLDDRLNRARLRRWRRGENPGPVSNLEAVVDQTRRLDDGQTEIRLKPRPRRPWVDP